MLLPPNVPTGFTATGASADNTTGGAVVTFAAPDTEGGLRPITSYQVENQSTGAITTVTSGATVSLAKNTTQTFRVRAVNSAGTSAWSTGDTALSFRQLYGGENGYYLSSTHYVTLPTNVTINYSISSGAGSTTTPDTRTYGNIYQVNQYNWFGYNPLTFDEGPYFASQVAYSSNALGGYSWYGYANGYNYIEGYFIRDANYGTYPYEEYYYARITYNEYSVGLGYNAITFGVYLSQTTGQTGGNAPFTDYGSPSSLINNNTSAYISNTSTGYNQGVSTNGGSFSGVSQIRLELGSANYNYSIGGYEAYYGPSGRGRIWYGT